MTSTRQGIFTFTKKSAFGFFLRRSVEMFSSGTKQKVGTQDHRHNYIHMATYNTALHAPSSGLFTHEQFSSQNTKH